MAVIEQPKNYIKLMKINELNLNYKAIDFFDL